MGESSRRHGRTSRLRGMRPSYRFTTRATATRSAAQGRRGSSRAGGDSSTDRRNGTTGATQVLPFLLLQLQFTRPRGCPGPTFPTLCPLRQVSFSVGSATPTNVSCAHFESSSDRSCAPASPATVRRRGDVPPNPNRVGPRSRSAQRPRPRNPPPPRTMRRMTRSTIAPTTATPKLGQFHPVTPDCPN